MMKLPPILRDEPTSEDLLGNAHTKIADTLLTIFEQEEKGGAIALLGEWGSGKSSIIKIAKEHAKNRNDAPIFAEYDAWAHDGDALRSSILQTILDSLKDAKCFSSNSKDNDRIYSDLKREIWEQKTKTEEKSEFNWWHFTSKMSLLMGAAGLSLLSIIGGEHLSTLELKITLNIAWPAFGAYLLAFSPLFALLGKYVTWKVIKKKNPDYPLSYQEAVLKVFDGNTSDTTKTITHSVNNSLHDFYETLEKLDNSAALKTNKPLVLILDNLDRVEPRHARKVWNSLTPFFESNFERLRLTWLVLPFSEEHLKQVFDPPFYIHQPSEHDTFGIGQKLFIKDDYNQFISGFLKKTFNIILNVPSPILANAHSFFESKVRSHLKEPLNLTEDHIINMVYLFEFCRGKDGCTTPRDILDLINRIAISIAMTPDPQIDVEVHAGVAMRLNCGQTDNIELLYGFNWELAKNALTYGLSIEDSAHNIMGETISRALYTDLYEIQPRTESHKIESTNDQTLADLLVKYSEFPHFEKVFRIEFSRKYPSSSNTGFDLFPHSAECLMHLDMKCNVSLDRRYAETIWKNAKMGLKFEYKKNRQLRFSFITHISSTALSLYSLSNEEEYIEELSTIIRNVKLEKNDATHAEAFIEIARAIHHITSEPADISPIKEPQFMAHVLSQLVNPAHDRWQLDQLIDLSNDEEAILLEALNYADISNFQKVAYFLLSKTNHKTHLQIKSKAASNILDTSGKSNIKEIITLCLFYIHNLGIMDMDRIRNSSEIKSFLNANIVNTNNKNTRWLILLALISDSKLSLNTIKNAIAKIKSVYDLFVDLFGEDAFLVFLKIPEEKFTHTSELYKALQHQYNKDDFKDFSLSSF